MRARQRAQVLLPPTPPMLTIQLTRDGITPHLGKLLKQAGASGPLAHVLGRAGANELKRHFRARNAANPNKLKGKRTNFWSAVAASVQAPTYGPGRIVIAVTHPAIAQKVHGGTITPKKVKHLAIPIHPAAHGHSPRVFSDLHFAMTKAGVKLLYRRGGGGIEWLYVLKQSVTQAADPKALPADAAMGKALTTAGKIHLRGIQ
jgi:hypothetical protein